MKLLKKRFSPTFHRYVSSRASRRPDHARARRVVTPRKITKRDACHRAPKTLRRPLTPASAHPHRLRPKTFKAARAPKYPRVSVPPMCKLDQFQVRAARLPAGLRPLFQNVLGFQSARKRMSYEKPRALSRGASAVTRPRRRRLFFVSAHTRSSARSRRDSRTRHLCCAEGVPRHASHLIVSRSPTLTLSSASRVSPPRLPIIGNNRNETRRSSSTRSRLSPR